MTTTLLTAVYKFTAVGAVSANALALRMLAIPVDLFLPNKVGLLYVADNTSEVGQVVTRTIQFRARPTTDATGIATLFPGNTNGSPVKSVALGVAGADYAAPPLVTVPGTAQNVIARVRADMGVGRCIVIAGGAGYVAPTIAFVGGQLAPGGTQATATITQIGGNLQVPVITNPGGPYQVPPVAVVTDSGGSGGIISPTLKVTALDLLSPGNGYATVAALAFQPFFSSCCDDGFPDSQKSMLQSWMGATFTQKLTLPVYQTSLVIS